MIHPFHGDSLPVSRWRNGGGETREIASFPPGQADFDWRLSIATLSRDGDFSCFPGVDRIITLLSGDSVALWQGDRLLQRLQRHRPFAFAGEEPIAARRAGTAGCDFNIMCRRSRYHPAAGTTAESFTAEPQTAGVVWVLDGRWQHPQATLSAGQGAWWQHDGGSFRPISADALLLWGSMTPIRRAL